MRRSLTAVAILTAVLAACGDDADDVGADDAGARDATTTTTADTTATTGGAQTTTTTAVPQTTSVGAATVRTRTEQEPLPQAFYECTNGPDKITFVRS